MLLTFNSWRGIPAPMGDDSYAIHVPVMASNKKKATTPNVQPLFDLMTIRSETTTIVRTTAAPPPQPKAEISSVIAPSTVTTKPPPLCWCPISGPGKLSFRDASDRLNPNRAFYQCGNRPSCSFFAWRETNEEYKKARDEAASASTLSIQQSDTQQPVTTTTTTTTTMTKTILPEKALIPTKAEPNTGGGVIKKKKKKSSNKREKIGAPEDITEESSSSATTDTQRHRPYPCSNPIAIPSVSRSCCTNSFRICATTRV